MSVSQFVHACIVHMIHFSVSQSPGQTGGYILKTRHQMSSDDNHSSLLILPPPPPPSHLQTHPSYGSVHGGF